MRSTLFRRLAGALTLLVLVAAPCIAYSTPPVKVSGRIVAIDGPPLVLARVRLVELGRSTEANSDGVYSFLDVAPGTYTLSIAMIGYAPQVRRITVTDHDITADFALKPSAIELSTVQVTASAAATSILNSPQPTTVVDADALRSAQAPSLGATLAGVPGVHSLSTGVGIGKPVIRGLTSNRVLVLDDGQRLETQQWGDEHSPNIEVAGVERIEVIRGPASVLYGSDALGGVINVIPPPIPDAIGRPAFLHGSVAAAYGSNNREPDGTIALDGASKGLGARVSFTGRNSEDARTPDYVLWNSGNRATSGTGALGYRGAWGALSGSYSYRDERIELTDEDSTATPYQRIGEQRGRLNLTLPVGAGRLEVTSGFEQSRRREFEDQTSPDVALGLLSRTYLTEVHYHHPALGRLQGLVGVSGYRVRFTKFGEETLIPNTTSDNVGAYAFEQADAGHWTFSFGGRFDYRSLDVADDQVIGVTAQTRTYNSVTGNVGVLYHVSEPVALVLNVGRGFRAPSSFDLFANGVHEGTVAFERGNPALATEKSLNTDLALRVQNRTVSFEVGGFVNLVQDFIFTVPSGTVDPASGFEIYDVTQGDAQLAGFESAMEVHPTRFLHLQATADYVRGQNTTSNQPLPNIPPFRATYTARLEGGRIGALTGCYLFLGGETNTRQTRLDPSEAQFFASAFEGAGYQSQAFTLVNVGAGFALPLGQRDVRVDLSLRNALNQRYADFLSRIKTNALDPGQGRNLIARVTWSY
jgi:iron complex outermembrane receptor protein